VLPIGAEDLVYLTCRFVFWRLNSRVVALHELLTHTKGYKQEDKWTFLIDGEKIGVPVSPVLRVSPVMPHCQQTASCLPDMIIAWCRPPASW
jgi:hypothetical protein